MWKSSYSGQYRIKTTLIFFLQLVKTWTNQVIYMLLNILFHLRDIFYVHILAYTATHAVNLSRRQGTIIRWGLEWCKAWAVKLPQWHTQVRKNESVLLYNNSSHTVNEPTAQHLHKSDQQQRKKQSHRHARMRRNPTKQRMMVIMTHSYATHSGACARAEHIKLSKCNTCSVSVLLLCTGM